MSKSGPQHENGCDAGSASIIGSLSHLGDEEEKEERGENRTRMYIYSRMTDFSFILLGFSVCGIECIFGTKLYEKGLLN